MNTRFGKFILYSSQSGYPSLHQDRGMLLPSCIRSQFNELLKKMDYLPCVSMSTTPENKLLLSDELKSGYTKVKEMRLTEILLV